MKKRVYLAGAITEDRATHEWRTEVINKLKDKFVLDDPAASKFDRDILKEAGGDWEKMATIVAAHQSEVLLPKSFQAVEKADIVLVNLELLPKSRPMVGTLMEVAWAYNLHKTLIAIGGDSYYSKHPMIRGAVQAWVTDVDEAITVLDEFFSSKELK